ncbi:cytochrome C peroxidase [Polyangium sorediatum]|uniref:Cytochrome C peroxidase n=1 Tax=Polyangium sorediatum TaxID=889274 RepID=A0ABT6NVC7_9BACT|nr:cytochrome C peroxidase [Polyangium sorediatum]MDI1432296.1 cytochrome C peroxidase [Polyangium sorediatum]
MRKSVAVIGLVAAATAGLAAGCGSTGRGGAEAKAPNVGERSCGRVHPGVGAKPLAGARQGGVVALAKAGNKTIAYVADEDDGTIHTVDVATGNELGTTQLGGTPSQLVVAADGRIVVALRDKAAIEVLEPEADPAKPLASRCTVPTPVEPVALATTPDDGTLLVTSGWGAALTAYDVASMGRTYEVPLPREPRSLVVSDDGKKAFVAHVVGSRMSVVDLAAKRVRPVDVGGIEEGGFRRPRIGLFGGGEEIERRACQGFALAKSTDLSGRIFAPQVLVDPGRAEERSQGYGSGGMNPPEVASVAVVDEDTEQPIGESVSVKPDVRQMVGVTRPRAACLLPRAAAIDPGSRSLFVSCLGIDTVIEYDAAAADPQHAERRRFTVAAGPTGLAVDPEGRRLVVWSQFDRTLQIAPLGAKDVAAVDAPAIVRVGLSRKAQTAATADLELGRKLFHASGDTRISSDGRACASCHPDGRDDALTWATPEGPRQTPMLAGRLAKTAPYGWTGRGDSVEAHLSETFGRLGGAGLARREIDALIAFATALRPPQAEMRDGTNDVLVQRGKAIFHSTQAGCGTCHHEEGAWTDHTAHDVSSRADADVAATFDTPSLRFVGGTAPYFHDGRYATLRSLLVDSDGKMGHTKHLAKEDLDALEAYMRSL